MHQSSTTRRDDHQSGPHPDSVAGCPRAFCEEVPEDRAAMERLVQSGEARWAEDRLAGQMAELAGLRGVSADSLTGGQSLERYARWVFLPWLGLLVRTLPPGHYRELRTARNRQHITAAEQERLRRLRVGVVGQSSGSPCALLLALEGLCGELHLADFDRLELGNLNRLGWGLADLGQNKARLSARRIWENDPYLPVVIFEEGVTEANLDRFFGAGEGQIHVLVEQCDCLWLKVALREEAKRRGAAVVMVTSDRGLLDVERYDLEPDLPLLGGVLGEVRSEELRDLDPAERQRWIMRFLGGAPSPRLRRSFAELGQGEVGGWPQTASELAAGAVQVATVVRRIGLGQPMASGRYYLDRLPGELDRQ